MKSVKFYFAAAGIVLAGLFACGRDVAEDCLEQVLTTLDNNNNLPRGEALCDVYIPNAKFGLEYCITSRTGVKTSCIYSRPNKSDGTYVESTEQEVIDLCKMGMRENRDTILIDFICNRSD